MTLGPSNDGIPKDELDLARIIQNAKARGLKWGRGSLFEDETGNGISPTSWPEEMYLQYVASKHISSIQLPTEVTACCAIGAAILEPDTCNVDINFSINDTGNYDSISTKVGERIHSSSLVGLGYRLAMQE